MDFFERSIHHRFSSAVFGEFLMNFGPSCVFAITLLSVPCAGHAAEPFSAYGVQHHGARGNPITQPSQQTRDAIDRAAAQTREDDALESRMQQRSDYLDQHGYDSGRRAETGDRFRYGADRTPDDYSRANAQSRFPADRAVDGSGNLPHIPYGSNSINTNSSTSSSTSTTTINQSQRIDASGNLVP